MKQILEWLIELINKLLGEGTIKLPDENTVPAPSNVPNEEDTTPDEEQEQEIDQSTESESRITN